MHNRTLEGRESVELIQLAASFTRNADPDRLPGSRQKAVMRITQAIIELAEDHVFQVFAFLSMGGLWFFIILSKNVGDSALAYFPGPLIAFIAGLIATDWKRALGLFACVDVGFGLGYLFGAVMNIAGSLLDGHGVILANLTIKNLLASMIVGLPMLAVGLVGLPVGLWVRRSQERH